MNYQEFVDQFETMTCILSVEKKGDGGYGTIRIVTGNKAYMDSIENFNDPSVPSMLDIKFVPNSPYERYIPKDMNFEAFCYKCAIGKKPMHTYVHPERFDFWFDIVMLPIESDDPNLAYCTYSQELSTEADVALMTDSISAETSSKVLQTCIKLRGATNFQDSINEVITDIRELCKANMCCILLLDYKAQNCSVIAESILEGADELSMKKYVDKEFFEIANSWKNTIGGSNCLIIQGQNDMEYVKERNPKWYSSLAYANVESLVLFPLKYNNDIFGYIWAINFDTGNTVHIKETLELTTFFVASEIANYQLLKRLETLSTVDLLTGIYNRNAMNNQIYRFTSGKERLPEHFGIIFADLNGLKQKNDDEGHIAGDNMLKAAAKLLTERFSECDIYRAGGDEFMIIALNMDKNDLEERIEKIRKDSEDPNNISFALGMYYDDDGGDIRQAMRCADERMYEDKERYYTKYPERKMR